MGLSNKKDELFDNHLFDDCYSIECKRKKKRKKSAVFDKINGYLTIQNIYLTCISVAIKSTKSIR